MKSSFGEMTEDEKLFWRRLGDKVFECRKRHLLNQRDLAEKLGVSRASIANIESGRQRMTAYRQYQIEQLLWKLEEVK